MNRLPSIDPQPAPVAPFSWAPEPTTKEQFRHQFQRSLGGCVRRGFLVEECFGVIWEETLDEVKLTPDEESALYEEMILWAKRWVR